MQRVALVFIDSSGDNFFIEDCPEGSPKEWIGKFVYDENTVLDVVVYELGKLLESWSNPRVSTDEEF